MTIACGFGRRIQPATGARSRTATERTKGGPIIARRKELASMAIRSPAAVASSGGHFDDFDALINVRVTDVREVGPNAARRREVGTGRASEHVRLAPTVQDSGSRGATRPAQRFRGARKRLRT